jgi:transketolase
VGSQGDVICLNRFGASSPGDVVMRELGFDVDNVLTRARALL